MVVVFCNFTSREKEKDLSKNKINSFSENKTKYGWRVLLQARVKIHNLI